MSRRIVYILVAVILVVILGLGWFFGISPTRKNIATTNDQIASERAKLTASQDQVAQAQQTSQQGKENQARLLELAKMVPNAEEMPSLLLQIQDLANQSGISFLAITPGSPVQLNVYQIIPLQLQFEGHFFDLSDFVYRAEQMVAGPGRLVAVKSLSLKDKGAEASSTSGLGTSPVLVVTMTLYAFEINPSVTKTGAAATVPTTQPTTATTAAGSTATTAAPTSQ